MKPEFMRLRRAVALTIASLIAAVGLTALSPVIAASAHHNTVLVSASCVDYSWKITWKITNSESDKAETIIESNQPALVPAGTPIGAGQTLTVIEQVAGPITKTLTVKGYWPVTYVTDSPRSATINPYDFTGTCAAPQSPYPPSLEIDMEPCVYGSTGARGTVNVSLSELATGWQYSIKLWANGAPVETLTHTATSSTFSTSYANLAPGTYYVTAQPAGDSNSSESASVVIADCTPATNPSPTPITPTPTTPAPPRSTLPETKTPTPTPTPVIETPPTETTAPPRAVLSEHQTRTLPSITATPSACNSTNLTKGTVSVAVAGLDISRSYYVKLVDTSGATAPGGSERRINDATSKNLSFTGVPAPGDYSAVLLVGPGKQLASDAQVALTRGCLSTLAFTGAGGVLALVLLAALLLGLGTVVIAGRLRRRATQ